MRLRAPEHLLPELRDFYAGIDTGETGLEFVAGEGEPFYHFAFLTPPDHFEELAAGKDVFDFDFWNARAFYFHDPAGTLEEQGQLAFVGERGRTFILAPLGRGWMPTGRPSERHPVEAEVSGAASGSVELEDGLYRIRAS